MDLNVGSKKKLQEKYEWTKKYANAYIKYKAKYILVQKL
jgi:hypothetical protein